MDVVTITKQKKECYKLALYWGISPVFEHDREEISSLEVLNVTKKYVQEILDFSDLSGETKRFIDEIEAETGVPVTIISTGPDLVDTIDLREELL